MQITPWHRQVAATSAAAHPLDGRPARATGNHLAAQNDEPEPGDLTEQDLLAIDRELNDDKAGRAARANDARALELQMRRPPGHWR